MQDRKVVTTDHW